MDPQTAVFDLIYGRWRSQTLYAGAKLGVFDAIPEQPVSAAAIAQSLGLVPDLLYRLLRALGSLGLLMEEPDHYFSLTETGKLLRSDDPHSLRSLALLTEGPEHYAIWKHLPAIIREGSPNGFLREFGELAFDYAAHTPAYEHVFDNAMTSHSRAQTTWTLEALRDRDFSRISHVCDVGGGQGHLLCSILVKYPHLRGSVLDRPGVFSDPQTLWAEQLHVADRCRYVPGDMFVDVPEADAYFSKMVLHDWNDEECASILRTMSRRAPTGGRLFIVEHVVPPANTPHIANLFDLHMMCWGTGRERTLGQYQALLQSAGWRPEAIWNPPTGPIGVIEAERL